MADIWIVSYLEDSGVRDAEYLVHLVCMNRLSAYRECCGVHSWQNGTRCRDGESVVVSFQSSWLLRVPSLHTLVFIQLVSVAFFWYCCLGMVREKRGGRGG